jgi:hypothetical protein
MARRLAMAVLLALAAFSASAAEDAVPLAPETVKARWHGRLDGRHFVAAVTMSMRLAGLEEQRRLTVYRDDQGSTRERVLIRFEAPADLRNVGLLYAEQHDRPNDYFFYSPATRRVRRLPASIADDDVYGIDIEFLGFGVAQTEPTEIEGMAEESLDGRRAYRLAERAREPNPRFETRTTWIDAETFVPLRTEHARGGKTVLVAATKALRAMGGVPTPVEIAFEKPAERRHVLLRVDSVRYDAEIPEEYFSVLALLRTQLGE